MEELKHNEVSKHFPEALEQLRKVDPNLQPVVVQIAEDFQNSLVKVAIGNMRINFTISQARDLAFEIRQAANRIEKQALTTGVKLGRRKRR